MRDAILAAALVAVLGCGGDAPVPNDALRARLAYLDDMAQVRWIDFEGGDVYIGFDEKNSDTAEIVNTAAMVGHKAHGKSVHVYAVNGGEPGWRPGDGPIWCEAEVRLGSAQQVDGFANRIRISSGL